MNKYMKATEYFVIILLVLTVFMIGLGLADNARSQTRCYVYESNLQPILRRSGEKDFCYNTQTQQYQYCQPIEVECK